jgi:hypothetical protein
MKKLAIMLMMGLALASTSFAAERPAFVGGHFQDHVVVRGNVGPRVGARFSYAPAPYSRFAPAYVAPGPYCPPVAGGVVVRDGFVQGRAFVGRDGRRFRR